MNLFKQASSLSQFIQIQQQEGRTIGFVPTMGALHLGHLSLLEAARKKADIVVCSIFVNPTQFNNTEDFKKYPKTLEKDMERLITGGCDCLFLPSVNEIYPDGYQAPFYELGELELVLEGHYRPGHFQGVCQVVDRLLDIVQPDFLFLGQKDYQQCQVIRKLISLTGKTSISLIISPTVREKDGLAMSSRNLRLSPEQRAKAPALYAALAKAQTDRHVKDVRTIKSEAEQMLLTQGFKLDYFEIADPATLLPASNGYHPAVALVAAYLDDIRLIDNLSLN